MQCPKGREGVDPQISRGKNYLAPERTGQNKNMECLTTSTKAWISQIRHCFEHHPHTGHGENTTYVSYVQFAVPRLLNSNSHPPKTQHSAWPMEEHICQPRCSPLSEPHCARTSASLRPRARASWVRRMRHVTLQGLLA